MSRSGTVVHAILPAGIDDPSRPSGGNVYDRRVLDELVSLGWEVEEHEVGGDWPHPHLSDVARLSLLLADLPDDSLLLVDGLVASAAVSVLPAASNRLRIVVLLHMPVGPDMAEETVLASAAAVVTTSEWARARIRSWYGLRPVHAVPPGTDPSPAARGSASGTSLLCVATVHPGKGHDQLLDALAGLGDRSWTLTCAGSLDVDPDHVSALQRQVYAQRWEDRVRFTGPLVGRALDAAYDAADVLVLASRSESYGMVVAEALAHGLPVIATQVGGVPEALGRAPGGDLAGLLVPPDDLLALTDALAGWLDDPSLRRRLAQAASARRPTLPGWDRAAAELSAVLDRVDVRVSLGVRR